MTSNKNVLGSTQRLDELKHYTYPAASLCYKKLEDYLHTGPHGWFDHHDK